MGLLSPGYPENMDPVHQIKVCDADAAAQKIIEAVLAVRANGFTVVNGDFNAVVFNAKTDMYEVADADSVLNPFGALLMAHPSSKPIVVDAVCEILGQTSVIPVTLLIRGLRAMGDEGDSALAHDWYEAGRKVAEAVGPVKRTDALLQKGTANACNRALSAWDLRRGHQRQR